ncbi:hypothetical protein B0A48_05289 [Cryoendolithus antarcticus]|uniref:DUF7730 domain-containing protein n=1 Tax=Cryoendolithus antarcticus TaxID=1507870 RepID=A0A1V8TIB5_9PEZI|nr:hypothetical protein B0A48_05289 [Cryoendolithus antarcticus]
MADQAPPRTARIDTLKRVKKKTGNALLLVCCSPVILVLGCFFLTANLLSPHKHRHGGKDRYEPPVRQHAVKDAREIKLSNARAQTQSRLIKTIPLDIRLLIWERVLGNVLHVEPGDGTLRWARCWDSDASIKLGVEHECWFDPWTTAGIDKQRENFKEQNKVPWKGDHELRTRYRLRPILLTCRLIYGEAIGQLYGCNVFSMRRIDTVLRLPLVMSPNRFQQIRFIDFSTAFKDSLRVTKVSEADRAGMERLVATSKYHRYPEPEIMWVTMCEILASLQNLQDLRVAIAFYSSVPAHHGELATTVNLDTLLGVLEPLKLAKAKRYEVKITSVVSDQLRRQLGPTPFELREHEIEGSRKLCLN